MGIVELFEIVIEPTGDTFTMPFATRRCMLELGLTSYTTTMATRAIGSGNRKNRSLRWLRTRGRARDGLAVSSFNGNSETNNDTIPDVMKTRRIATRA